MWSRRGHWGDLNAAGPHIGINFISAFKNKVKDHPPTNQREREREIHSFFDFNRACYITKIVFGFRFV